MILPVQAIIIALILFKCYPCINIIDHDLVQATSHFSGFPTKLISTHALINSC